MSHNKGIGDLTLGLRDHIIRKLISTIPTFLVASVIVFSLMHLTPGDPVELIDLNELKLFFFDGFVFFLRQAIIKGALVPK